MSDEAVCIELLPRVSRTFALSIEALPEPLRRAVRAAYLLCRIVDTIEDDPALRAAERARMFDLFQRLLADDGADPAPLERAFGGGRPHDDDADLCRRAGSVFRQFRQLPRRLRTAIRPHVYEMAGGMAHYSRRWRGPGELTVLTDLDDLHRYCFFVAGTVGNMLTDTFIAVEGDALDRATRRALRVRAARFGHGLQMTNITKDVRADHGRGWCFLPARICERHGIAPGDLLQPEQRDRAMGVIREVAGVAGEHLDLALEYTLKVPADRVALRLFLVVPLVLAHGTLELVARDPRVLDPEGVKLSREAVAGALLGAQRTVTDDDGLRKLCATARAGAL